MGRDQSSFKIGGKELLTIDKMCGPIEGTTSFRNEIGQMFKGLVEDLMLLTVFNRVSRAILLKGEA